MNRLSIAPKSPKLKLPRIEIIECKVKTKNEKKLDLEMFQQAKDAKMILDKLLKEDNNSNHEESSSNSTDNGRRRANSLDIEDNVVHISNKIGIAELAKKRGSVPNIGRIKNKIFRKSASKTLV
ncbi:uncharacterized protein LOC124818539 [Hydra vulgaris]|uniref:Uncharacterized protein LOC124818539 n=1 Tax=Hydra vulgaris TaxID=6087 RepID=A0ABM4D7T1_HYDVU